MGEKYYRRPTMKRVEIIVEGQTEQEFVTTILAPYLYANGVGMVMPIRIRTSATGRGGFTNYQHLKNDVVRALSSKDPNLVVSMFVDFFRIPQKYMPGYDVWGNEPNHFRQVTLMEAEISKDIADRRFVPYIQMHEFEALLFSSNTGVRKYWSVDKCQMVEEVIDAFDNPECINTSPDGAPSKRLLAISPDYQKVLDGNILALEVGIDAILAQCPRFAAWVHELLIH